MTSIRRVASGIASSISRATSLSSSLEVTAPVRKEVAPPVEPVRRGFSDQSDFQPGVEDLESPLLGHVPLLAGRPGEPTPEPLRSYTGESDFQARAPRYGHLLGTNVPPPRASLPGQQAPGGIRASSFLAGHTSRPSVDGASLKQAHALAGPEDRVLLYLREEDVPGHAVVCHLDGHVTDPVAPDVRYADSASWERSHPGLSHPTVLTRDDVELVLGTPEGPERDELLAYFAPDAGSVDDSFEPATPPADTGGFIADLSDLPQAPAPEDLLALLDAGNASSSDFMVQETDAQPAHVDAPSMLVADNVPLERPTTPAVPTPVLATSTLAAPAPEPLVPDLSDLPGAVDVRPERLATLSPNESLDIARDVAASGSPEQQAQVATALYTRAQTPETAEATTLQRAAALAASGSPEATQALLSQVGDANVSDFVRAVMQDGAAEPTSNG